MPTALTPYRLYQVAKYAWSQYAFPSIAQAVTRLRPNGQASIAQGAAEVRRRHTALRDGGYSTVQESTTNYALRSTDDQPVSVKALAPSGASVSLSVTPQVSGSGTVLRDRRRSDEGSRFGSEDALSGQGKGMGGLAPRAAAERDSSQLAYCSAGTSGVEPRQGGSLDLSKPLSGSEVVDRPAAPVSSSPPPPIPGDDKPSRAETSRASSSSRSSRVPHPAPSPSSSSSSPASPPPSSTPQEPASQPPRSQSSTPPPAPRSTSSPTPRASSSSSSSSTSTNDVPTVRRLLADSTLFTPGFQPPRNVVVLCHGLYGFSTATPIPLFPSLKLHYWHTVLKSLRDKLGCKVMVVGVNGTGSIEERANQMNDFLERGLPKGTGVNFVAHSMGGLDCRYLITHLKPRNYKPLSLTMIGTPNRGSPFMDWCAANIGVGTASMMEKAAAAAKAKLPPYSLSSPILSRSPAQIAKEAADKAAEASATSTGVLSIPSLFGPSITNYLLGLLDHPAYGNLTTHFLNETFNPETPDDPNVKYTSTGGRISKMSVLHPLWFPKLILDAAAERGYAEEEGRSGKDYEGNDGLVSVSSAKWGEWMGVIDNAHHWDLRGEGGLWPQGGSLEHKPEGRPDPNSPDGWDWKAMRAVVEKEEARTDSSPVLSLDRMDTLKKGALAVTQALDEQRKNLGKVATGAKSALPDLTGSWDMAQVGQVVDWVGGLMPGTTSSDGDRKVGVKQMADARKEKAKQEEAADLASSGNESWAKSAANSIVDRMDIGGTQTGETGQRSKGTEEKRKEKEKFDVGRFYGALMVKIREDGF